MRTKTGDKEKDILEAAISVFAENGYHNAKIQKIAILAGVAIGSVYVYYKNKEAIFSKIVERLWTDLYNQLQQIDDRADISTAEKFDALIDVLFDAFFDKPFLARAIISEGNNQIAKDNNAYMEPYRNFMTLGEKIVEDGIKENIFNPNIDIRIVRSFIFGGFRFLLYQWACAPQDSSLSLIRQNVKFFCKKGMLNSNIA